MTPEEIKSIKTELSYTGGCAKLRCDGTEITVARLKASKKTLTDVLVIAAIEGVPNREPDKVDEALKARIYRDHKMFKYAAQSRRLLAKMSEKRRKKEGVSDPNEKVTIRVGYWNTVESLIRDLVRQNASVEFVGGPIKEATDGAAQSV